MRLRCSNGGGFSLKYPNRNLQTGLKRRVDDLQERIAKFTAKPFIVLVPNETVAEEYRKKLANDRATVKTLREFLHDNARP